VAEEDQPLDTRILCCLSERARPFNIGRDQIAAPSLGFGTGKVIDMVHAAQGCADTALVAQADDRYFDGNSLRDARGLGRGTEKYADLLSGFREVTNQGAPDKSRCASNQDHIQDYSRG
jgi:hypothetical protein